MFLANTHMLNQLNLKKIQDIKPCFEKIFKKNQTKLHMVRQRTSFFI